MQENISMLRYVNLSKIQMEGYQCHVRTMASFKSRGGCSSHFFAPITALFCGPFALKAFLRMLGGKLGVLCV
jgi:hypothetical protein